MKKFNEEKYTAKENSTLCEKICFYDEIIQTKKISQPAAIHMTSKLKELLDNATDADARYSIVQLIKALKPIAS